MSIVNFDLKTTRIFDRNRDSKAKIIINRGGARAGKSHAIAQLLFLNKFLHEKKKQICVLRKTLPSLRTAAYKTWKDWLGDLGLTGIIKEEKQYLNYYYN